MKKICIFALLLLTGSVLFAGCTSKEDNPTSQEVSKTIEATDAPTEPPVVEETIVPETPKPKKADLRGEWVATDKSFVATITKKEITISWNNEKEETTSLYWVGTFSNPKEAGDYTWESVRDKEATDNALMASTTDKKTFKFSGDTIRFSMTIMGTTKTIKMKKVK